MNGRRHDHDLKFRQKGPQVTLIYGDQIWARTLRVEDGDPERQIRAMAAQVIADHNLTFAPEVFPDKISEAIAKIESEQPPVPPKPVYERRAVAYSRPWDGEDVLAQFLPPKDNDATA